MNILKLFPLPRYLQIPATGVDISDRSIKYAELKKTSKGLKLKHFGKINIEKGIVEKGLIKKKSKLIHLLKEIFAKTKNHFVLVSLPEEKAFLKVVEIPKIEDTLIKKTLEGQLEENVPLPPSEVIFDFEIISKKNNSIEVALSAFPKSLAQDYLYVFNKANLFPLAFEIENQALFRALVNPNQEGAYIIIDLGRTRTGFLIGEKVVKFSSTLKVGGEDIDKILAKNFQTDIFEAERIKKESKDKKVLSAILPILSIIKDETKRIMIYWQSHLAKGPKKEIEKIILCGGDANLEGVTDYLSYELKKPVELGNPWLNINSFENYIPEIEKEKALTYTTALGLALRSFLI